MASEPGTDNTAPLSTLAGSSSSLSITKSRAESIRLGFLFTSLPAFNLTPGPEEALFYDDICILLFMILFA